VYLRLSSSASSLTIRLHTIKKAFGHTNDTSYPEPSPNQASHFGLGLALERNTPYIEARLDEMGMVLDDVANDTEPDQAADAVLVAAGYRHRRVAALGFPQLELAEADPALQTMLPEPQQPAACHVHPVHVASSERYNAS